jgi:hypothetical protein
MATIYSPKIITDGLVLALDAANPRSYPGSGNTWYDLSGNNIHAYGSSALSGGYLSDTQPYTTSTTSILNDDTHTIFLMLQINGVNGGWSKIFGYEPSGTDRSPGIWRWPSTRRIHWRYDPSNTGADFSTDAVGNDAGTEFSINVWYYVGVTKNGSVAKSYTNGAYLGQQTVSNPKTSGNATIKLYPSYNQNTSKMALVHIYNRVLSDQEIQQNYNALKGRYGL